MLHVYGSIVIADLLLVVCWWPGCPSKANHPYTIVKHRCVLDPPPRNHGITYVFGPSTQKPWYNICFEYFQEVVAMHTVANKKLVVWAYFLLEILSFQSLAPPLPSWLQIKGVWRIPNRCSTSL